MNSLVAPFRFPWLTKNATFAANTMYVMPTHTELQRRFPGNVNPEYASIAFVRIEACMRVCLIPTVIGFEYFRVDDGTPTEIALSIISKKGFRPAMAEELLSFDAAYPRELQKHPIIAMGSIAHIKNRPRVPILSHGQSGRCIGLGRISWTWGKRHRLLVVCKDS